jgi:hypothetical protein
LGMTQIRMTFMTTSRVDWIWGMLMIIQSKMFCLPISCQKIYRLEHTRL